MEKQLILHCSPTLAGIKTANLFNYAFSSKEDYNDSLYLANQTLNSKGVYIETLRIENTNALVFVYRKSLLTNELMRKDIKAFLEMCGYQGDSIDDFILKLKSRFEFSKEFPHEIGLFLGYPLPDVIGFIKNKGKHCKYTGHWKVYSDEYEAVKLFEKYQQCRNVYTRLFFKGKTIDQLTIVA